MALNKQVHLYGVDTSYFYNKKKDEFTKSLIKCILLKAI